MLIQTLTPEAQAAQRQIQDHHRQQLIIRQAARMERMVRAARRSILGLAGLCLRGDKGGDPFITWFMREWDLLLRSRQRLLIKSPRGSTKTSFCVEMAALWFLGNNPDLRIKIICGTEEDAVKRLATIKSFIKDNALYQATFPHVAIDKEGRNDRLALTLKRTQHYRDASVEAKGILSSHSGGRFDILFLDDVCTYRNTLQEPAMRQKIIGVFLGDILPMAAGEDARIVAVYTPWHKEDLNAYLERTTKNLWTQRHYAHGKPGDPYHSMFPELYSKKRLKAARLISGALEYARAYLCRALADNIQLVRAEWLRPYGAQDLSPRILNNSICSLSIDPAGGKNTPAKRRKSGELDFTGFNIQLLYDYTNDPNYRPGIVITKKDAQELHQMREPITEYIRPSVPWRVFNPLAYGLRLTTEQIAKHTHFLARVWHPDIILVETQGAISAHDWIIQEAPHLQGRMHFINATLSKKERLSGVTPLIENPNQQVLFHPQCIQPNPQPRQLQVDDRPPYSLVMQDVDDSLRLQLLDFPTTHDDIMDAFVQNLQYASSYLIPDPNADPDSQDQEDQPVLPHQQTEVGITILGDD